MSRLLIFTNLLAYTETNSMLLLKILENRSMSKNSESDPEIELKIQLLCHTFTLYFTVFFFVFSKLLL